MIGEFLNRTFQKKIMKAKSIKGNSSEEIKKRFTTMYG
jgi:hypothetical protein